MSDLRNESSDRAAPSISALAPSAPASDAPPLPAPSGAPRSDGCWGIALASSPADRLAQLGARCAEGMSPLFEPARTSTDETTTIALPPLAAGTCVRAAAVAAGSGVDVAIVDENGRTLAEHGDEPFGMAPAGGPLCPRVGAKLSVRIRRRVGSGPVVVQAWATK